MLNIIDKYMQKLTIEDVDRFAKSKNINLSQDELDFTYHFVKKNYREMIKNPNLFNIERYQNRYSIDNFNKIKKVFIEYFSKYQRFL